MTKSVFFSGLPVRVTVTVASQESWREFVSTHNCALTRIETAKESRSANNVC